MAVDRSVVGLDDFQITSFMQFDMGTLGKFMLTWDGYSFPSDHSFSFVFKEIHVKKASLWWKTKKKDYSLSLCSNCLGSFHRLKGTEKLLPSMVQALRTSKAGECLKTCWKWERLGSLWWSLRFRFYLTICPAKSQRYCKCKRVWSFAFCAAGDHAASVRGWQRVSQTAN